MQHFYVKINKFICALIKISTNQNFVSLEPQYCSWMEINVALKKVE